MYDDDLHEKASTYASNRKNVYLEKMKQGDVENKTQDELNWIWLAHYEGYREGFWVATGNTKFSTNPAKLKEKNT